MKKKITSFYPQIILIGTDGSTVESNFVSYKDDFYIKPDVKSNTLWLPKVENVELEGLANKSSKFKKYQFNFASLISDKKSLD
jgi:hypothetical protein